MKPFGVKRAPRDPPPSDRTPRPEPCPLQALAKPYQEEVARLRECARMKTPGGKTSSDPSFRPSSCHRCSEGVGTAAGEFAAELGEKEQSRWQMSQ
jgi:hypothetical protein